MTYPPKASDDLVERLRERDRTIVAHHQRSGKKVGSPFTLEGFAADEIERLRERCEAYKCQVKAGAEEIERLKAQLAAAEARLPALSNQISEKIAQLEFYQHDHCHLDHARTIAEGRIMQAKQIQVWIAEALRSIDGADK